MNHITLRMKNNEVKEFPATGHQVSFVGGFVVITNLSTGVVRAYSAHDIDEVIVPRQVVMQRAESF